MPQLVMCWGHIGFCGCESCVLPLQQHGGRLGGYQPPGRWQLVPPLSYFAHTSSLATVVQYTASCLAVLTGLHPAHGEATRRGVVGRAGGWAALADSGGRWIMRPGSAEGVCVRVGPVRGMCRGLAVMRWSGWWRGEHAGRPHRV